MIFLSVLAKSVWSRLVLLLAEGRISAAMAKWILKQTEHTKKQIEEILNWRVKI